MKQAQRKGLSGTHKRTNNKVECLKDPNLKG